MSKVVEPKPLETVEQVNLEMIELIRIEADLANMTSNAEKSIAEVFETIAPEISKLEAKRVSLHNRLMAFAQSKQDDPMVFPKGVKTLTLMAGEIQLNAGKPSIQFLEGVDEKTALIRISDMKLDGLTRQPDLELDKESVMRGLTENTLTPAQLTAIGLKRQQEPSVNIKVLSLDKLRKQMDKKPKKGKAATQGEAVAA